MSRQISVILSDDNYKLFDELAELSSTDINSIVSELLAEAAPNLRPVVQSFQDISKTMKRAHEVK